MRVGCVPVASDLAGVRDVVGSTGVLVPPRRAARLREELEALAADPARVAELSARAIERASALTWDRCVQQYEHVLTGDQHD
jgi:glycosyltransferase involved in cell wall biosynthesis